MHLKWFCSWGWNKFTLTDCEDGYYGDNCKMVCTCLKTNTEKCNVTNGACSCRPGWKGHNCDIDIEECEVIPELCHNKSESHCVNTIGSFKCDCNNGYIQANVTSDRCIGRDHIFYYLFLVVYYRQHWPTFLKKSSSYILI